MPNFSFHCSSSFTPEASPSGQGKSSRLLTLPDLPGAGFRCGIIFKFLLLPLALARRRRRIGGSLTSSCCGSPAAPAGEHGSPSIPFPPQFSRCHQRPTTTTDPVFRAPQASPPAAATGSSSPTSHAGGAASAAASPAPAAVLPAPAPRPQVSLSLCSHHNFVAVVLPPQPLQGGRLCGRKARQARRQLSLCLRDPTVRRRLCERAARVSVRGV